MKTINDLLEDYGRLMHEAGIVKGELLAKLHLAKEFADMPDHVQKVQFTPMPVVDLLSIPPSERIEWDEKYKQHGSLAGMVMRALREFPTMGASPGEIYAKALQLYPDRTFNKDRFTQTIYSLVKESFITKNGRGHYKQSTDIRDMERPNLGESGPEKP